MSLNPLSAIVGNIPHEGDVT